MQLSKCRSDTREPDIHQVINANSWHRAIQSTDIAEKSMLRKASV